MVKNILVCGGFICITLFAIYQNAQINRLQLATHLSNESRHLMDDGFKEMFYVTVANLRDNQLENIKNTGKVEGMLAVIANQKPSDSENAAIWHAGYYRGIDQQNEVAMMAYEDGYHRACDDIACPANSRPTPETIRAKSPYNSPKQENEIQPVSNNKPSTSNGTKPNEEKPAIKPNQSK